MKTAMKTAQKTEQKRGRKNARKIVRQEAFPFRGRGGARKGAGRKPKGARAGIPHRSRAEHAASHPVQTTTRLRAGLPSLRHAREFAIVRRAIQAASERPEFRVIHYSIQSNHLHLIVEAADRRMLSKGMSALLVRIARGLNRLWQHTGAIFADRFHERALRTPTEVRNSLVYVLQNARKHGIHASGPDAYSSGPWFDGWRGMPGLREALARQCSRIETTLLRVWERVLREWKAGARSGTAGSPLPKRMQAQTHSGPVRSAAGCSLSLQAAAPKTWLLSIGWRRNGWLDIEERPASVSQRQSLVGVNASRCGLRSAVQA